jgi:glutamate formiminotransferase
MWRRTPLLYDLRAVIECVPNFSEGIDADKVRSIASAIGSVEGVLLLDWELDADHNRSVVTFAGPADAVVEGAIRGAGRAAESIDLSRHQGAHPRVGVADVIPFIPLEGDNMETCIAAARTAADGLWKRLGIPSYFYEAAALTPERRLLEKTRRSGFDGKPPDVGDVAAHPTAGASMVGARGFLVAYNVDLQTKDVAIAQAIARRVRASSGGFPHVKAMGLYLPSRDCAQVSMNLTRYEEIPLMDLLRTIDEEAVRLGTGGGAGELIGFIPRKAFEKAPEFFRRAANFSESRILEVRMAELSK